MSQENVEIVRTLFAAFRALTSATSIAASTRCEIFDPEVEWVAPPHSLLASGEYRGYDGVRRFWTRSRVQVDELIDAGDQVVAVMRLSGRTNEHRG